MKEFLVGAGDFAPSHAPQHSCSFGCESEIQWFGTLAVVTIEQRLNHQMTMPL
jgi:hypothetical protein